MSTASHEYVAAQLGITVEALAARRAAMPEKFLCAEFDGPECSMCDGTGLGMSDETRCWTCKGSGQHYLPRHYLDN